MSDPAFPAHLPAPSRPLSSEAMPQLNRTEMENGHVRQTQRFDVALEKFGVNWLLTQDQMQLFRAWHRYALETGARWFTMNFPENPFDQSNFMVSLRVRFAGGSYRRTWIGHGEWTVEATLETEEAVTMSAAAAAALIMAGGDAAAFMEISDLFHEFVHTTLPASI